MQPQATGSSCVTLWDRTYLKHALGDTHAPLGGRSGAALSHRADALAAVLHGSHKSVKFLGLAVRHRTRPSAFTDLWLPCSAAANTCGLMSRRCTLDCTK